MAGYETSDINCWEAGWSEYSSKLGAGRAKTTVTELACWVRIMRQFSTRKMDYFPLGCKGFCRDECVAISMIAACQHKECPALKACAFALIGPHGYDEVIDAADNFAAALQDSDIHLSKDTICNIAGFPADGLAN